MDTKENSIFLTYTFKKRNIVVNLCYSHSPRGNKTENVTNSFTINYNHA